jgi:hypothetical protein
MTSNQHFWIEAWKASGRIAHVYPRLGMVALNGGPRVPISEAVERIKACLLPDIFDRR